MEGERTDTQPGGGADAPTPELERITARLEQVASELEGDPGEERTAELVREASELAARAGREVEAALGVAAEAR